MSGGGCPPLISKTPTHPPQHKRGTHPPLVARTLARLPVESRRRGRPGAITRKGGGYPSLSMRHRPHPLSKKRVGDPLPTSLSAGGVATPLVLQPGDQRFVWTHAGDVVFHAGTGRGGGYLSCARRGTHPLPRSEKRVTVPPPPTLPEDRLPPPMLKTGTYPPLRSLGR